MWKRFGGWVVAALLGAVVSVAAQPLAQLQGELERIAGEIARVGEVAADLAVRASVAVDFEAILEIERKNFELEKRLHELTGVFLEQEGAFLEVKPELLHLAAAGEARAIDLLITLEELIAKIKGNLAMAWMGSAQAEENLVSRKKELLALPGSRRGCCVTFDTLAISTVYLVGDTFTDCAAMRVYQFQWSNGTLTGSGYATVILAGLAGGSGKEINLNNVNLIVDFGHAIKGLTLKFGEYGGNLNIMINGDRRNFQNFRDIDGMNIGGAHVSVPVGGHGNDKGILEIHGEIQKFYVGGQELYIDDICPIE